MNSGQITAVAVVGSFVFGYSVAVMNSTANTIAYDFHWCGPDTIYCSRHTMLASGMTGIFFVGTGLGSLVGGRLADHFGRKRLLITANAIICLASLCILIRYTAFLAIGRFLSGVACGFLCVVVPMLIHEWTPQNTPRYGCYHQILITLGIFAAVACGSVLDFPPPRPLPHGTPVHWIPQHAAFDSKWWRCMHVAPLVFSLCQIALVVFLLPPYSPLECIRAEKWDDARRQLERIYGLTAIEEEFQQLCDSERKRPFRDILVDTQLRSVVIIGVCFATLQQLVGINVAMARGCDLFLDCGLTGQWAQNATVGMTLVQFCATLGSARMVPQGRKNMLYRSFGGMAACMAFAVLFTIADCHLALTAVIILFVMCFSSGVGPLTWVINAELYPPEIRSTAMSVATSANQLMAFIVIIVSAELPPTALYLICAFNSSFGAYFVWKYLSGIDGPEDVPMQDLAVVDSNAMTGDVAMVELESQQGSSDSVSECTSPH